MKGNNVLLAVAFWILLVSTLAFVSAGSQVVSVSYDFENNIDMVAPISYDSGIIRFETNVDASCRYSEDAGISYSVMGGVFDDGQKMRLHSLTFLNLDDGINNYYIKCKENYSSNEPAELHVALRVNSLVTGEVSIDKPDPINSDKIQINLETSKNVQSIPSLTYSYNGVNYLPLTLVGEGREFRGELAMSEDLEEGTLSFKMSAYDLEGRKGVEIKSGAYFSYDFVSPKLISDFRAISRRGEIELNWKDDEEVDNFRIYRSEFANLDYLDFYESVKGSKDEFVDTDVESGKTYYYRISAVDSAGNEGSLSKELTGTSLLSETDLNSGLSPQLHGTVDSFIVEINSVISELDSIKSTISSKVEKERNLFERLGLNKKLESSEKELNALKMTTEKLKDQDLTRESLDSKINSNRVKLGIIEKGIPEDISILEEDTRVEDLTEEKQGRAIQTINNIISEKGKEKSIKESNNILKENPLKVSSIFYNVRVDYVGNSKSEYSVVLRSLESKLVAGEDQHFIEVIPEDILSDSDLIEVGNMNYDLIGNGNVISFETDTKEIFYYIPKVTNFKKLADIEFSFVKVLPEENGGSPSITGFSIFEAGGDGYIGYFVLILVILVIGYFIYFRKNKLSDDYFRVSNRITEAQDLMESKDLKKSKELYLRVKRLYSTLPVNEKNRLYGKVEDLYNEILIYELEEGLEKLKITHDKELFLQIEKRFNSLSVSNREKLSPLFEKIKEEFDNDK